MQTIQEENQVDDEQEEETKRGKIK